MAPMAAIWAPIAQRVLRQALRNTSRLTEALRNRLLKSAGSEVSVQPIAVRSTPKQQPIHPLAFLRQQRAGTKWYSTTPSAGLNATLRRFLSGGSLPTSRPALDRTAFLKSPVATRAVWQSTGRAPFACALRPNLTGGALPRTAGGYSLPGRSGSRYFSHTPAAPAQVVQQVSQAARAFWTSGQRARFDGVGSTGENRYRAVSVLEADVANKLRVSDNFSRKGYGRLPGAFIDFPLNPTITALSPLAAAFPFATSAVQHEASISLAEGGFLDVLSADFARALQDLTAVMGDLKRLASLGDLPVLLEKRKGATALRVRFPGVDAETVERICDDLSLTRGLVGQDVEFDSSVGVPVALRFPFAPDATNTVPATVTSPGGSLRSHASGLSSETSEEEIFMQQFMEDNPWLSSVEEEVEEGYESLSPPLPNPGNHCSHDFEGMEGIYRFLEECDRQRSKF